MKVRITVDRFNLDDVASLQRLAEDYFGDVAQVEPTMEGYTLTVLDDAARYLFDQLRIASEDPAFESYTEWLSMLEAQCEMNLGDYSPENPIYATAG